MKTPIVRFAVDVSKFYWLNNIINVFRTLATVEYNENDDPFSYSDDEETYTTAKADQVSFIIVHGVGRH